MRELIPVGSQNNGTHFNTVSLSTYPEQVMKRNYIILVEIRTQDKSFESVNAPIPLAVLCEIQISLGGCACILHPSIRCRKVDNYVYIL
jgi:hypothetical protein